MIEFRAEMTLRHYEAKLDDGTCLVPYCTNETRGFCGRHWNSITEETKRYIKRAWATRDADLEETLIAITYAIDECINLDTA